MYRDSSVTVHLHKESEKIRIKRGVRQGDTISPKLFTATFESILFRRLNWKNTGVKIGGEFIYNLRFADVIILSIETENTPINVNIVLIGNVQGYVYIVGATWDNTTASMRRIRTKRYNRQRITLFVQGNIILRKFNRWWW